MRIRTYNEGAAAERQSWMRHIRHLLKECPGNFILQELVDWGLERSKRCNKRIGGIGRR